MGKQATLKGVEEIKRAGGRLVYRGRVRDTVTGERFSETFETADEARAWQVRRRREIDEAYKAQGITPERRVQRRSAPRTLGALADAFFAQAQLAPASLTTQRGYMKAACRFFGSDTAVSEIERPLIREWVAEMVGDGLARGTRANRLSTLRGVFALGVEYQVIASNPVDHVGVGQASSDGDRRVGRYPTEQEVVYASYFLPPWLAPMVWVAADSGFRRGELCGLRWRAVNLERRAIYVGEVIDSEGKERPWTKARGGGGGAWEDKGKAWVPMSPRTAEALRALRALREAGEDDHVFRVPGEDRILPKALWRQWDRARRLGMDPELGLVRVHDLRWVTATSLAEANVPVHVIMRVMRHATPRMTHRYISTPDLDQVTELYDRAFVSM